MDNIDHVDSWSSGMLADTATQPPRFKVLLVVGSVRSGSTVLGNLLAELDGFVHVGELHNLWKNLVLDKPCGCGRPLSTCPIWSRIRDTTLSAFRDVDGMIRSQTLSMRARHLPRLVLGHDRLARPGPLRVYAQALHEVYESISRYHAARVIIDSSKMPPHALAARLVGGSNAYFIHLVRDPRGVAYSRLGNETMRPELREQPALRRRHLMRSSWQWAKVNAAAELVCAKESRGRVLRVRYEDFVVDPDRTVAAVARLLDESARRSRTLARGSAPFIVNHTVGGNANRFRTGPVEIEEDMRWVEALDRGDRLLTGAAAIPLFHRYGYRLSGRTSR